MHSDPRVMATLGGVRTLEQTREYLRESAEHWERFGFGLWLFREIASGRFAGRGGLRHVEVDGESGVELAYSLAAELWRRGLATEMAREIVAVAFAEIEL